MIDDEAAVRDVLRLLLEGEGLTVIQARDGVDGLCAFRLFGADLVLCEGDVTANPELLCNQANIRLVLQSGRIVYQQGI